VSGWPVARLDEVVTLQRGFDLPASHRRPGKWAVLGSNGPVGSHDEAPVRGPGVVIGRATNLGRPTWWSQDFWPLNTTLFVKDFRGNDPRFVYYLFEQLDLSAYDSGSVQPMLNRNYIAGVPVLLPPVAEQRRIAEILGAIDDTILCNGRIVNRADALADSLFESARSSLEQRSIRDLATAGALLFSDGYRTRRDQLGSPGLPILRVADLVDGHIEAPTGDSVRNEYLEGSGSKCSLPGDIVISTKGTVGRTALTSGDDPRFVYSPQLCFVRVLDEAVVSPPLLHRWARSPSFHVQAAAVQGQTDMAAYINLSDFSQMLVPVGGAQGAPATAIRNLNQLIVQHRRESRALALIRGALLPRLLSGELHLAEPGTEVEGVA
jgi:type I restriction enzyme S subunit